MNVGPPVHVKVPIRDEFAGDIEINYTFSEEDAWKVIGLAPSVARLYFGHEMGAELQMSLKMALEAPLEP